MLKDLLQKLQNLTRTPTAFDPSQFNDPLAMQTEWTPAKGGGANFKTHNLVEVNFNHIEFRSSVGAKIFYLIFLVAGLGIMIGFTASNISAGNVALNIETLFPIVFGLIFAGLGGTLLYFGTSPIVFDKGLRKFWKGRKSPREVFDESEIKKFASFENIHAIQLISEYVRSNKSSYYSYELNLVLKDGSRINVIDHGNKNKIRENAAALSAFLEKQVWDAIS
jgi:hypothetical protein